MMVHVSDLDGAVCECFRILRPRGKTLLYTTLETNLMEPRDAERLYRPLAIRLVRHESLERSFISTGFHLARAAQTASEMLEFYAELHPLAPHPATHSA